MAAVPASAPFNPWRGSDEVAVKNQHPLIPQESLWRESIAVIKSSLRYGSFERFYAHLQESLPQNSVATRERYARYICKRFFPDRQLDQIGIRVWRAYRDEGLLEEVMRYQFLAREPLIADFLTRKVLTLVPGLTLPTEVFQSYVEQTFGKPLEKAADRIRQALVQIGFLAREHRRLVVRALPKPKTTLLILTHYLFAPTPQTVELRELLANPFWRYLGVREAETVRGILKEADASGLIAKYIKSDQLEQITTRYSFDALLEQRIKL